ncbi:hypothetical protein LWI29_006448 [Acer saccharum]|uniref:Peptidase S49 domain-containing protein n=1 Tax=Acer saccharum TaxID=4024 RepID=A0AA39RKE3_ACESA|nr:hypothetical protein LWI29_006448 [Acer saccharum]
MKLSFGNMTVELNVFNVCQQPPNHDDLCEVNFVESVVHDSFRHSSYDNPSERCLAHFGMDFDNDNVVRTLSSVRAFDDSSSDANSQQQDFHQDDKNRGKSTDSHYPSGEFEFQKFDAWKSFSVKLRMLIAYPWERVRKGSVLKMTLRGQISDQLKSRFSSGLSLPKICENFIKAAYDPRVSGIYLHIESLNCGWGKFIIGYVPACGEKEYYLACACEELYAPPSAYFSLYGLTVQASFLGGVLEKVGVEPQVQRIGKYKSAGDQLTRKTMSEENCEMLTALLDNIYENWLDKVSSTKALGDALASDLMWREIRLLAESKPVVASMSDVAASGGYYMAMAAQTIIAEI